MQFSAEEINKKFEALPEDLKRALTSSELYEHLKEVADKYKLLIDDAAVFEQEVSLVFLGLTPSSDFKKRIKDKLDLSSDVADKLTVDVNESIFKGFREALMKIQQEEEVSEKPKMQEENISREDLLREIEKIESSGVTSKADSVESKLQSSSVVRAETIDLSPKNASSTENKRKFDPYREPIE